MPETLLPWQQLALIALGVAGLLTLLFRLPYVGRALQAAFSFALLAIAMFILLQQAPYDPRVAGVLDRLGLDRQEVAGAEMRIPMSHDGHFWAKVEINGAETRMLIDSGATLTALSIATAERAGVQAEETLAPIVARTANGLVQAHPTTVERLRLGRIEAHDLKAVVSPSLGSVDVLGMNFLMRLEGWRVEGRTLILTPARPAAG